MQPPLAARLALSLGALLAAPVAASPQEAPETWGGAPPERAAAAADLAASLDAVDGAPDARLAALRTAARDARRALGDARTAALIADAVRDARWRALVEPAGAVEALEARLRALASDLAHAPVAEAPLPVGFPGPTPVHEVELKRYPAYRLAETPMQGGGSAFFRLFQHISEHGIAMTAPVETTLAERGGRLVGTRMAFLYESPRQGPAPAPEREESVRVVDVPSTLVLSLGCRGDDRRDRVEAARDVLLAELEARPELEVAGDARVLGYNSPRVRGGRRSFEVQLPVRERAADR